MGFEIAAFIALIIAQLVLVAILSVFIVVNASYAYSGLIDVPYISTPPKHYPLIADALGIQKHDVMYDLGCGNGAFLIYCAKRFPDARFIGIERNPFVYWQACIRKKYAGGLGNLTFWRGNFYTTDTSDATKIYAYLLGRVIERLFPPSAYPGVRLASRAFQLKNRTPDSIVTLSNHKGTHGEHLLYVYQL